MRAGWRTAAGGRGVDAQTKDEVGISVDSGRAGALSGPSVLFNARESQA